MELSEHRPLILYYREPGYPLNNNFLLVRKFISTNDIFPGMVLIGVRGRKELNSSDYRIMHMSYPPPLDCTADGVPAQNSSTVLNLYYDVMVNFLNKIARESRVS